MICSIFDVSNVVYCGGTATSMGLQVGGLIHLNNLVCRAAKSGGNVILVFDSASFRKELSATYKKNRIPRYDIYAQTYLAEKYWRGIGLPVVKVDGFEADDLIYSIVIDAVRQEVYDKIYIYSGDRDLACNVSPVCDIRPVSDTSLAIDFDTYEDSVVSGKIVTWNTILLYKVFHGDASDTIMALKNKETTYEDMAKAYVSEFSGNEELMTKCMSDINVFSAWIAEQKYSEGFKKELLEQCKLVFPRYAEVRGKDNFLPTALFDDLDKVKLQTFLSITKSASALKYVGMEKHASNDDFAELGELAGSLANGTFVIDKNLPLEAINRNIGETLFLGSFE
jgi:5'-3' exonuclease